MAHLRVGYGMSAACEQVSAQRHAAQSSRRLDSSSRMHLRMGNLSRMPMTTTIMQSHNSQPSLRRQGTSSLSSNGRDNPETWGDSIDDWDNGPSTDDRRRRRASSQPPPPPPPPPPPFPGQPTGAPSSGEGIDVGTVLKLGALTLVAMTITFALVTVAILSSGY